MANRHFAGLLLVLCTGLAFPLGALGQTFSTEALSAPTGDSAATELKAVADALAELRAQVQALSTQVSELREEGQEERDEVRALREALQGTNRRGAAGAEQIAYRSVVASPRDGSATSAISGAALQDSPAPQMNTDQRLDKLEEEQELLDSKMATQYQSKVESASNYRIRLSGIALLNLYENRGSVDNQDFPEVAEPQGLLGSAGAFGGSLRQSQIGVQVFGPEILGAHTSADLKFDFAGGFADEPNGVSMGLVRLRTETIRLDWDHTSVVAGQDRLFFVPLAPTSLATLAVPALSYAGNLWSWTPQVRVEHQIKLTAGSSLLVQAGILDSFSGDIPEDNYERDASWGERSGQPAYAARVAWSHKVFGQDATVGAGGYYGRQD